MILSLHVQPIDMNINSSRYGQCQNNKLYFYWTLQQCLQHLTNLGSFFSITRKWSSYGRTLKAFSWFNIHLDYKLLRCLSFSCWIFILSSQKLLSRAGEAQSSIVAPTSQSSLSLDCYLLIFSTKSFN